MSMRLNGCPNIDIDIDVHRSHTASTHLGGMGLASAAVGESTGTDSTIIKTASAQNPRPRQRCTTHKHKQTQHEHRRAFVGWEGGRRREDDVDCDASDHARRRCKHQNLNIAHRSPRQRPRSAYANVDSRTDSENWAE
eukprot:1222407-Rhodomonas_salina.3